MGGFTSCEVELPTGSFKNDCNASRSRCGTVAEANQRQEAHVPPTPPNPKLQQKAEARGHSISMSAAAECSDLSQNCNGRAAEYLYSARGNDLGAPWVATSANGDPIDSNKISFTRYFH